MKRELFPTLSQSVCALRRRKRKQITVNSITIVDREMEEAKEVTVGPLQKALSYVKKTKLSEIEFILFGFAMMMGNRTASWNSGLAYGYPSYVLNLLFAGAGYLCFCLCAGEMSSALPFSGGAYGFVRASLGPYFGFLVACCEFVYCTCYTVLKILRIIAIPSMNGGVAESLATNIQTVIIVYGVTFAFNLVGGKPFYSVTTLLGLFITMVILIYLCGTISLDGTPEVNFTHYSEPVMIPITWENFMAARIAAGAQFNGVQYFTLLSGLLKDPKVQVPRMLLICTSVFICMSVFVSIAAIGQESGGKSIVKASLPLQFGLSRILNMNLSAVKWIDLPCQFGSIFCLFHCAGKQLHALTKSGLLPAFLDRTIPGLDTPYLCYTIVFVMGVWLSVFCLYYPDYVTSVRATSLIASFFMLIMVFISFMVFRRKFSSLTRSFVNPLGDSAAIFGIVCFLQAIVGVTSYSDIDPIFLIGLGSYLTVASIFFWTYLVHNQKFSDEEKKLLFKAYLINANRKSRQNRFKKNNKVGPGSVGSASKGGDKSTHSNASKSHAASASQAASTSQYKALPSSALSMSVHHPPIPEVTPKLESSRNDHIPATRQISSSDSSKDASSSIRQAEKVSSKVAEAVVFSDRASQKLSTKIITYLSSKLNAVVPAMNNMDEGELREFEQLAVVAAGGELGDTMEEALEERYGLEMSEEGMIEGVRGRNVETGEMAGDVVDGVNEVFHDVQDPSAVHVLEDGGVREEP